MTDKNLRQMKTGEVAERARQAGVQNVEQMNKQQLVQAVSQARPQQGRAQQGRSQKGRSAGGGQRAKDPRPPGTSPQQWKNVPGNQT